MLEAFALSAAKAPEAVSLAVANLFRDACVKGELRLDKDDGELVRLRDLPHVMRSLRITNQQEERTQYVRMKNPASTYVFITTYDEPTAGRKLSECIVTSRSINFEDAAQQLFEGTPETDPRRSMYGNPYYWRIDVPERNYTKELSLKSHGFTVLKATLYAAKNSDPVTPSQKAN